MKPFDIEAAKKGIKVQTKNGLPARIICYDVKRSEFPKGLALEAKEGMYA